jgi:hypothetical protein
MVLATSLPSTLREGTEVRNDLFSRGCWTLIDRALLIAPLIVQPVNGGDPFAYQCSICYYGEAKHDNGNVSQVHKRGRSFGPITIINQCTFAAATGQSVTAATEDMPVSSRRI